MRLKLTKQKLLEWMTLDEKYSENKNVSFKKIKKKYER